MLGKRLVEATSARHQTYAFTRRELDITSMRDVRGKVGEVKPDWIVHAAAFTRVNEAESNPEAFRVNALGSRNLAAAAFENGSSMLYFSTDYVFDGRSCKPYREWDRTSPINEYGKSKLAGENFVRSLCPNHLIIRTSWLFGPDGSNFVDKIIELARGGGLLKVVNDQRGSPTYTRDLAVASLALLERGSRGVYHVTNSDDCSWHEFAQTILRIAGLHNEVAPDSTRERPAEAHRPAYSVLDNCMLKLEGRPPLRNWGEAVAAYLESRYG